MARVDALVIVAHPDDETLWAGGMILDHSDWRWTVVSLCRGDDPDRAPKFSRVLSRLGAEGAMGRLDDGPDQRSLAAAEVEGAVRDLAPPGPWDVVFTHSPFGEYTRHRRHEEIGRAVMALWQRGEITTDRVRMFAYEDGGREYLPRAIQEAHDVYALGDDTWGIKVELVQGVYGFAPDSWEGRAVPRTEAFWRFASHTAYRDWLRQQEGKGGDR